MAYFSIEVGFGRKRDSYPICKNNIEKMTKKTRSKSNSKKLNSQQKKFKRLSKVCHKTPTKEKYYKCMSKGLKKR